MRHLHELLSALDDEKRAVFVLAELEQMTAPEIADALSIKLNTVYSRLRAARKKFETALQRHRAREFLKQTHLVCLEKPFELHQIRDLVRERDETAVG